MADRCQRADRQWAYTQNEVFGYLPWGSLALRAAMTLS